jgi:hypothetical protein
MAKRKSIACVYVLADVYIVIAALLSRVFSALVLA